MTYALLQAGTKATELATEITALVGRMATEDPYELALIGCALQLAGRPEAQLTRQRLAELQRDDGSLHGTTTSITMSGGRDLDVNTSGFAVLAWLPDAAFTAHVRRAVDFLQGARDARGTFGATQATIVALRAMTAYAQANRSMREPGSAARVRRRHAARRTRFCGQRRRRDHVRTVGQLAIGEQTLRLELDGSGKAPLPWACDVSYHSEQPADDPDTKVTLRTGLRATTVTEGDTVALDVTLENRTDEHLPMTMAIVGLPAGLELPTRVLEDLQRGERFAFWELRGRELALYWREVAPRASEKLTLDLVARIPGRSTGPASRTYLLYTPQQKRWAAPLGSRSRRGSSRGVRRCGRWQGIPAARQLLRPRNGSPLPPDATIIRAACATRSSPSCCCRRPSLPRSRPATTPVWTRARPPRCAPRCTRRSPATRRRSPTRRAAPTPGTCSNSPTRTRRTRRRSSTSTRTRR